MFRHILTLAAMTSSIIVLSTSAVADEDPHSAVSDEVLAQQRAALAANTDGAGFGPQSPRDIDSHDGSNARIFAASPTHTEMNLCNIHFHENAEHRGGEFTHFAGNGDGHGYGTGFQYNGELTEAELTPLDHPISQSEHGDLEPGDTIEVHFVHTTAQVQPGPTLGACMNEAIGNPQLRVETQVIILVNDDNALSFMEMTQVDMVAGYYQAPHIPTEMGVAVQYAGSTTGPGYNESGSPFQVTWSVRPQVARVNIHSVGAWLENNIFEEDHAHGVRNLVVNPDLLSLITQ